MTCRYLTILILLLSQSLAAQTHTLGRPISPVDFERPIDLFDNPDRLNEIYQGKSEKSKDKAWMVISDRDNNPTFDKPNGKAIKTINFRDFFYVTDEKGAWINIAKGRADKLDLKNGEDYGWVEKSKMLIWNSCFVQERSMISEKVFLVGDYENPSRNSWTENTGTSASYDSPLTNHQLDNLANFRYYFVYKKENDRYLIGDDFRANVYNVRKVILGWVPAKNCTAWSTRICVEPNFEKKAFEERKNNTDLRFIAYKSSDAAAAHATNGTVTQNQILTDTDPCKGAGNTAPGNPFRYPGTTLRFPLLSYTEKSANYLKIGIFSKAPSVAYSEAFIPKKIAGAQFPTSSYVVFMPQRDLSEYVMTLRRCIEVSDADYNTKRSTLFNTMADLMRKGMGTPLSNEECAQKTFNQFVWAMQGAEEEDMVLADRNDNFLLGDIIAVNKMTSEKIDALFQRVEKKMRDLQRINTLGKDYEFSYSVGDEVYFWIPVGDIF